ncbi:MAG: hypothetical protein JSS09_09310, partial [Verrucomicrobia bacterium]|nr:hypothetical protein [Verrucomicrobiota bacterium]
MKNLFQKPSKTHFLLAKCVIASLALHSTALYLWINHPILFKAPSLPFFTSTQPQVKHTPAKEEFSVDTALEEFFDDFFVTNKPSPLKSDPNFVPHIPSSLLQGTQLEKTDNILSIAPYRPYLLPPINLENSSYNNISFKSEKEETAHFITFDTPFPSFCPLETEKQSNLHSFPTFSYNPDPLIEDFISLEEKSSPTLELQIKDKKLTFSNIPYFLQDSSLLASMKEAKDLLTSNEIPPPSLLTTSAPSILAGPTHDFLAEASLAEIDDYLPTNNLYGLQWNNSFSLTPSFFADEDGYVFSLTLNSLDTLETERIKQNFYFLVDVSSSVENHKIAVFKRSVIKALSSLQSGDYFNIFLLDKKITRLSPNNLPFSFQNLRKAEEFLERKNERAIFSSFDLFQGLDKSLDFIESNDEVHTA